MARRCRTPQSLTKVVHRDRHSRPGYRTTAMEAVRMSMLTRSITLGVLALGVGATALAAQQKPRGYSNYRWYIGGQGGVLQLPDDRPDPRAGFRRSAVNTMIIAKRTGLLVSVDDALGSNEVATIAYAGSATGYAADRVQRRAAVLLPHDGLPVARRGRAVHRRRRRHHVRGEPAGAEHGRLYAGRTVGPLPARSTT